MAPSVMTPKRCMKHGKQGEVCRIYAHALKQARETPGTTLSELDEDHLAWS